MNVSAMTFDFKAVNWLCTYDADNNASAFEKFLATWLNRQIYGPIDTCIKMFLNESHKVAAWFIISDAVNEHMNVPTGSFLVFATCPPTITSCKGIRELFQGACVTFIDPNAKESRQLEFIDGFRELSTVSFEPQDPTNMLRQHQRPRVLRPDYIRVKRIFDMLRGSDERHQTLNGTVIRSLTYVPRAVVWLRRLISLHLPSSVLVLRGDGAMRLAKALLWLVPPMHSGIYDGQEFDFRYVYRLLTVSETMPPLDDFNKTYVRVRIEGPNGVSGLTVNNWNCWIVALPSGATVDDRYLTTVVDVNDVPVITRGDIDHLAAALLELNKEQMSFERFT